MIANGVAWPGYGACATPPACFGPRDVDDLTQVQDSPQSGFMNRGMSISGNRRAAVWAAGVLVLGLWANGAEAQEPGRSPFRSLGDMLFPQSPDASRATAPAVARYVSETGEAFVLDRSSAKPLLRFEGSNEVWVLDPQTGARGDTLYKTDAGRVLLRGTKAGGLTIFTHQRREGAAAALAGETRPIRLSPVSPKALYQRLFGASSAVSRAARRQVPFQAEATPASSALIADAAVVTADGLIRMGATAAGRSQLDRVQKVFITEGPRPGVVLRKGVLIVVVAPSLGLGGRPSSERVASAASH